MEEDSVLGRDILESFYKYDVRKNSHKELASGGLGDDHLHDGLFHFRRDPILQERFLPGVLL